MISSNTPELFIPFTERLSLKENYIESDVETNPQQIENIVKNALEIS